MTSRIYWYPRASSPLVKTDPYLGLTDFQPDRKKLGGGGIALGGKVTLIPQQGYDSVRLVCERRSERMAALSEWRDEAHTLVDHLQRGGSIGFALDTTKAFLCAPSSPFIAGLTTMAVGGNLFSAWESAATLAADDRMVISSSNPDRMREENTVSAYSAGSLTLDREARFEHSGIITIRHWGFYPVLKLDPAAIGQNLAPSERGFVFTLTLPLIEDVSAVEDIVAADGMSQLSLAGTGDTPDALTLGTLDDMVARGGSLLQQDEGRPSALGLISAASRLAAADRVGRDGFTPLGFGYRP